MEKLQHSTGLQDYLKNDYAMLLLVGKMDETLSFFEKSIGRLERSDLIKICHDIGMEKLVKEDTKKSEIIRIIFNNVPITDLLRNKRLQERLKPKYISIADIRALVKGLETLKTDVSDISEDHKLFSNRIWAIESELKDFSQRLKSVEGLFSVGTTPDLQTYLKALYEEAVSLGEKPSPESFHGISERLQKKLGIDERTFILKGIELLLAHYFLSQVKSLSWKPPFEDFLRVLREVFDTVKITGDQAEIPKLREHVTRRMGISDQMFDSMLIDAQKMDHVKLDVGAPIGEYDVKYLVTTEGSKFYYVKLKR